MDRLFFVLASRFVDPFTLVSQKGPLGGDTYGGKLKYEWKRPLMGPVVWAATSLFRLIPGVVPTTAIALGLALLATLNLGLAYLVARRLTASPSIAMLATGCHAFFLSTLIGLSIVDSYTVSSLMVLLVLYVWLRDPAPSDLGGSLRLGGAVGLAGLCNTPLLLLAGLPIVHALLAADLRRTLRVSLLVGGRASAMVAAVVLTHAALKYGDPAVYFERSGEYAARYAAADRLLKPSAYADVPPSSPTPSRHPSPPCQAATRRQSTSSTISPARVALSASLPWSSSPRSRCSPPSAATGGLRCPSSPFSSGSQPSTPTSTRLMPCSTRIQLRPALFVLLTLGAISLPGSPRMAILALAAVAALLGPRNLPIVLAGPYDFKVKTDLRKAKASKLGIAAATCNYRHPGSPRCRTAAPPDRPSTASSQSPGRQHVIR